MTTNEPQVAINGRYSVTQASALLGVHRNTINNYANSGRLKYHLTRYTFRKVFTGRDLLNFWRIEH